METALRQIRAPVLVTAPTVEPVSVGQLKTHCAVDHGLLDDAFADWGKAARLMVETDAEIALASSAWALYLDEFPCWEIELRKPPVQSITSVVYLDGDGTSQTLASTKYRLDAKHLPPRLEPSYGNTWPTTYYTSNAVTITFLAGPSSQATVDTLAVQAIKLLVGHWYRYREAIADGETHDVGLSYKALIDRLRWSGNV